MMNTEVAAGRAATAQGATVQTRLLHEILTMDDAQLWEAVMVPFLTPDMSDEDVKDILADDSVVDTLISSKIAQRVQEHQRAAEQERFLDNAIRRFRVATDNMATELAAEQQRAAEQERFLDNAIRRFRVATDNMAAELAAEQRAAEP